MMLIRLRLAFLLCAPVLFSVFATDALGKEKASPNKTTYDQLAYDIGFNGMILVGRGDAKPQIIAAGTSMPDRQIEAGYEKGTLTGIESGRGLRFFDLRDRWRWASVTKQVVATLVLQEVAKGTIALDQPLATYLPNFRGPNAAKITIRQLLRHQSGLPNPDDTAPDKAGVPAYYSPTITQDRSATSGWCAGAPKSEPGGNWAYNNCDFIVAGAVLEAVTGQTWQELVASRIAKPLGLKSLAAFPKPQITVQGFSKKVREPAYRLEHFAASGALYGTPYDLWKFDRALMTGKLLPKEQLDELWDGKPELGFIALGQWVFEASLKSCAKPVRIVERRGAIGGVQVRNFILPEADMVVIAFTNRGEFEFGEIWQGSGFAHDLLDTAVCQQAHK
jgi:D-alanyl-D-alanine carboxypeptidase